MKAVKYIATFVLGAAAGAAASWFITKKRYEQIANDEIDEIREFYRSKSIEKDEYVKEDILEEVDAEEDDDEEPQDGIDLAEYMRHVNNAGYDEEPQDGIDLSEYVRHVTNTSYDDYMRDVTKDAPYVIPPDEYGDDYDYERITLTYYSKDCFLVDERDELVEDVEGSVGFRALTRFGEWEDDVVYVQNDRLKCYYEILLDERRYTDAIKSKPDPMEVE